MLHLKPVELALVGLLLIGVTYEVQSFNPGVRFRMSSNGLNELADIAMTFLRKDLKSMELPELKEAQYRIYNLRTVEFDLGTLKLLTSPPNIVTARIVGASIKVTGKMQITANVFGGDINISGDLASSASGVDISQGFHLENTTDGKLMFSLGECSASMATLSIDVSNAGWMEGIMDAVLANLNWAIKINVEKQICSAINQELGKELTKVNNAIKVDVPVINDVMVNLALVRPPAVTEGNITVAVLARFFCSTENPEQSFPFSCPPLPALPINTEMFLLQVSDYVFNTFLYSLWQNGALEHRFTLEEISATTGFNVTISMLRNVFLFLRDYPNRTLEFGIRAVQPPWITISPSGITMSGVFQVDVGAELISPSNDTADQQQQRVEIISVTFNATMHIVLRVVDDHVTVNVTDFHVDVTNSSGVQAETVNQLARTAISTFLPSLNRITTRGIQIPSFQHYEVKSPSVTTSENVVTISADIGPSEEQS